MISELLNDLHLASEIDDLILDVARIEDIPNTDLQGVVEATTRNILTRINLLVQKDVKATLGKYEEQAENLRIDSDELLRNIREEL